MEGWITRVAKYSTIVELLYTQVIYSDDFLQCLDSWLSMWYFISEFVLVVVYVILVSAAKTLEDLQEVLEFVEIVASRLANNSFNVQASCVEVCYHKGDLMKKTEEVFSSLGMKAGW